MTPHERAEKIALDIHKLQHPGTFHVDWNENGRRAIDHIASEIAAAVEEAIENASEWLPNKTWSEVQAEAYEDAAKMVDDDAVNECGNHKRGCYRLAESIRARAAERGRQCDQYHCGHDSCNAARAAELLTDTKPDGD